MPAAPMLVVLLQSSSSRQIAEQSAWALGQLLFVLHAKPAWVIHATCQPLKHHMASMSQQPPLICTPASSHMQQTMFRPHTYHWVQVVRLSSFHVQQADMRITQRLVERCVSFFRCNLQPATGIVHATSMLSRQHGWRVLSHEAPPAGQWSGPAPAAACAGCPS